MNLWSKHLSLPKTTNHTASKRNFSIMETAVKALETSFKSLGVSGVKSKYDLIREAILPYSKIRFLHKEGVLEWLYGEPSFISILTKESENEWGCNLIGKKSNQWTTLLGEYIMEDMLRLMGKNPRKIQTPQKAKNGKRLDPDRETDDALYECKARNYTTTGTAGEKILGSPIKYAEVYRLYNKPLTIVCMAFQQKEAEKDFMLFAPSSTQSPELRTQLQFWEEHFHIRYTRATDLLEEWLTSIDFEKEEKKDA